MIVCRINGENVKRGWAFSLKLPGPPQPADFYEGRGNLDAEGISHQVTQEGGHSPGWGSSAGKAVKGRKKEKGNMGTMRCLLSEGKLLSIIIKNRVDLGLVSLE